MTVHACRARRVAICDDAPTIRRALRLTLGSHERIEVVAEADDGVGAIEIARTVKPDVMLIDVSMPVLDGISATPRVLEASPDTTVLIMSAMQSPEIRARALAAGAAAFLEKGSRVAEIVRQILEPPAIGGGCGTVSPT